MTEKTDNTNDNQSETQKSSSAESTPDLPFQPNVGSEFDNINVVVRVRPVDGKRNQDRITSLFPAAGQIQVTDPISGTTRSFTFNVVFEPEATQEEIFEHSGIKRLIDMALEGFACTIFAYGQTGSGKTFTLCGNYFEDSEEESKSDHDKKIIGLVQLTFAYLFEQIKVKKEKGVYYVVTASYLEVYNEQVLDLLNPSHKCLNVRWSKDRGFYAENLFKVECEDIGDLEGVLVEGTKNRQVRSHQMNEKSSRSHSLLTISLASETQDPEDPQGYIRREGRLCLVDLAGSEKTKRTQSKGDTLIEANNINRSLLVLGNCISALASSKRRGGHIPYRDSTLTKLLADSLSGSGMTLMVACVSAASEDACETINTLRYAARAKKVKTNPIVRMDPRELLILSLKREVRLLRMENIYLRQQLNLGNGFIANGDRPTSNESGESGSLTVKLKDGIGRIFGVSQESNSDAPDNLLHKYMQQNEGLRAENAQLHQQRERLIHDHEMVCRENDRLRKRLSESDLENGFMDSDADNDEPKSKELSSNKQDNNPKKGTISINTSKKNDKNSNSKKLVKQNDKVEEQTRSNNESSISHQLKENKMTANGPGDKNNNQHHMKVDDQSKAIPRAKETNMKSETNVNSRLEIRGTQAATRMRLGRK